ncbi:MAG: hypothetical protein K2O88_01440 [Paramuribaculum sp.]|nr:hypothetical protein [Paramuribaculum sp.]
MALISPYLWLRTLSIEELYKIDLYGEIAGDAGSIMTRNTEIQGTEIQGKRGGKDGKEGKKRKAAAGCPVAAS